MVSCGNQNLDDTKLMLCNLKLKYREKNPEENWSIYSSNESFLNLKISLLLYNLPDLAGSAIFWEKFLIMENPVEYLEGFSRLRK